MNVSYSRQTTDHNSNRRDPYYQYLKYGSRILFGDGSDGEKLGIYQPLLMEEPQEEEYRQCWKNFREEKDPGSREKLICWNLRMVYAAARCLVHGPLWNMEVGDLMGYGCLGLIEALDRYDESEGKEFSNYAFLKISIRMWKGMENFGVQRSMYRKIRGEDLPEGVKKTSRYRRKTPGNFTGGTIVWEEEVLLKMAIRQELDKLGKTEAQVLERICRDGMTQIEAAEALSMTLYETRKCLKNTTEKLKNYLEDT